MMMTLSQGMGIAPFRPRTASHIIHRVAKRRKGQGGATRVWRWHLFIPASGRFVLFSGLPKIGKTSFTYGLLMAIARGKPYLDYATRQGSVLILAVGEEHPEDIEDRLVDDFGLTKDDPVHSWEHPVTPEMLPEIAQYVVDNKVKFVLIDSLSSYWNPDSENSNTDIHRWIVPLRNFTRLTRATLGVIHHNRKGGGQHGEQVRGGNDLFAQVDQSLLFSWGQNLPETQRLVETLGRYRETPKKLRLEYTGNPPRYVSLGEPTTINIEQRKARVLSALREGPKEEATLSGEQTGLGPKPLKAVLNHLLAEKRVARTGKGVKGDPFTWKLAANGTKKEAGHGR